ncbi:nucleic acid-binding protein [Halorubellus sp. JP-L1]|uniref:Zn-ribbon domain-containing OB-fold protein n=1 Tax=Halorubellus sp. JP-L1 TaxID=2715753 RepID=UPI00140CB57E|nr:OB-fold domain-containing protein [Halorubellus sp. JP-L1]NHN40151.1 nucleic acid-binding protein [Halorubellus sp. JP-L1]
MSDADEEVVDAGYDEWVTAVADGEGYYLECENDHGSLPPRRVCPHCGSLDIAEVPLPEAGEIQTFTVTHVATPNFTEDTPYAVCIARFGDVRVTGQMRDVAVEDVEVGLTVEIDVAQTETTGDDLVVFRPR